MELKNGKKTFYAKTRKHWRKWLEKNHQAERFVWLIIYRKETNVPSVYYPEAVEEALCFGWIDSKGNKRDDKSHYLYFARRNPKSNWSKINKQRVEKLAAANLLFPAGVEMIEIAKKNGCWNALDDIENFVLPGDLQIAFDKSKKAFKHWTGFPNSTRKQLLEWIGAAKTKETRLKRITQVVELAKDNIRANQYVKK
jgi:uncharacterized protein YdeI (YjbR/CyaY-like superfamily)